MSVIGRWCVTVNRRRVGGRMVLCRCRGNVIVLYPWIGMTANRSGNNMVMCRSRGGMVLCRGWMTVIGLSVGDKRITNDKQKLQENKSDDKP
ncbi:MAG: hypothetical protein HW380_2296 [Magnetococcales bacterium]|nr:hypothetical protein [Magnetococcales bacterium]